tara:strand:+ start:728 stop:1366 length:639 start_codon:yes stop_codon:yes gene_type:complete
LLINSLSKQPLIIVIRLKEEDFNDISKSSPLFLQIDYLNRSGVKHIEIAWSSDHRWPLIMEKLVQIYDDILFGAASIVSTHSLKVISELNLTYAMSPIWDINLQEEAKSLNQLLIPGVFSPTEMYQAKAYGCQIIKLFPAASLGIKYLNQLKAPLGEIPFTIAAGGLKAKDIEPWLNAGYDAIALGRKLIQNGSIDDSLKAWLNQIIMKDKN